MSQLALNLIRKAKKERLTKLDLGNCGLRELPKELFELVWLEELTLSSQVQFFKERKPEPGLFRISNNDGPVNIIDHFPVKIGNLKNLKVLLANGSYEKWPLSDLAQLETLTELEVLDVSNTQINGIESLKGMKQLKWLNISQTQIRDLTPLNDLADLKWLDLSETKVRTINPLRNLFQLNDLFFHSTEISDLTPLKDLKQLEILMFSRTNVNDLSPLSDLYQLNILNISSTLVYDLNPLKSLSQLLILGANSTPLSDLSPLKDLTHLQILKISNTLITDLSALKDLSRLLQLDISLTNVNNISPLKNLTQLVELNISSTQVSNLSSIENLFELQALHAFNLPLKIDLELLEKILNKNSRLNIYFDPTILNIPKGLESDTNALREYLKANKEENKSLKIILLGNTRAGKSQLVNFLKEQKFEVESKSTPGIQIVEWNTNINGKKYSLVFYDFGGQDYYHATHNLYLDTQSLYLVLWHPQVIEEEQHMSLGYWLGNIDYFTDYAAEENIAIWTLQTRSDDNSSGGIQSRISIDSALQKLYNVDAQGQFYLSVKGVFQDEPNWKLEWEYFKAHLEMKIIEITQKTQIVKETADVRDRVLPLLKKEGSLVLTKKDFIDRIETILEIKTQSNQATLTHLSAIGRILWFKHNDTLKDYIFPDPAGLSGMIFEVLENNNMALSDGEFSDHDLSKTLKNKTYKNKELIKKLFIDLLLEYQIIFERPDKKGTYVVPQYLPDQKLIHHLQELIPISLVIRYEHYMPFWRISHFITKKGSKLENDADYWRYGIIYRDNNCKILVKVNRTIFNENEHAAEQVNIHVIGPANERIKILTELLIFFGEVHSPSITSISKSSIKATDPTKPEDWKSINLVEGDEFNEPRFFNSKKAIKKTQLSTNGLVFFSIQDLSEQIGKSKYMQTCDNKPEQIPSLFYPLFNQSRQMPKRVFFSYAHADAQYRRELENHFAALKRSNLVETWHDMEIIPGENWDNRIMEEIKKADIILGLISSDFMNSSYIWEKEIPKLEANNKTFVPVFLRPCYIEGSFIEELQGVPFDNQKKGKDQKSGIQWIVSSRWAYRDEAYLEVIKSLKMLLDQS